MPKQSPHSVKNTDFQASSRKLIFLATKFGQLYLWNKEIKAYLKVKIQTQNNPHFSEQRDFANTKGGVVYSLPIK